MNGVRDRIAGVLRPRPEMFIAHLLIELSIYGRGEYVTAGNQPELAAARLRTVNEIVQLCAQQLASLLRERPAYPDEAFAEVLVEQAELDGWLAPFAAAVELAAGRVEAARDEDR